MLARPNKAKNAATLLEAFGKHPTLRNTANLALFLGQRDDLQELGTESQAVLNEVFALIDRYNLYGHVAYPKQHQGLAEAVYRFTAETRGIFCNPALYESFGLTILEAAASGLPVVVTQNGGAKDIVANLENGVTVDPQDPTAMGNALCALLENKAQWQQYQSNGKARVADISSWKKHVSLYQQAVTALNYVPRTLSLGKAIFLRKRKKLLVCDIDDTLTGGTLRDVQAFNDAITERQEEVVFAVATGRNLSSTVDILKESHIVMPDVFIPSVGTEIYVGWPELEQDAEWKNHLEYLWQPNKIRPLLNRFSEIEPQGEDVQTPYKISYICKSHIQKVGAKIRRQLEKESLLAKVICSHDMFIDVVPLRASKGSALRYLAWKWDIETSNILVAGNSGNDLDMYDGRVNGIVVANHTKELNSLLTADNVYKTENPTIAGVVEGIEKFWVSKKAVG
jgi:sucrose-phosphate synthase